MAHGPQSRFFAGPRQQGSALELIGQLRKDFGALLRSRLARLPAVPKLNLGHLHGSCTDAISLHIQALSHLNLGVQARNPSRRVDAVAASRGSRRVLGACLAGCTGKGVENMRSLPNGGVAAGASIKQFKGVGRDGLRPAEGSAARSCFHLFLKWREPFGDARWRNPLTSIFSAPLGNPWNTRSRPSGQARRPPSLTTFVDHIR